MGRLQRLTFDGALHHVTMRCNNKEFLFEPKSMALFLEVTSETCLAFGVLLYNYCIMTNHVHLLFEVGPGGSLPQVMHRIANVFAKRFNAIRGRKGHLWEQRYRSAIVDPETYFLRCMAFIDLNPVRARIVDEAGKYQWSAHRDVLAEDDSRIALHRVYLKLGEDRQARTQAYLEIIREEAAREPHSLANVLFVGSAEFVSRMQQDFSIVSRKRMRLRRIDLGGGVYAIEPAGARTADQKMKPARPR